MALPRPDAPSLRGAVDLSSLVSRATHTAAAEARGQSPGEASGSPSPDAGTIVFAATDASFESVLDLSMTVPVIVEFYAAGIEPALASVVESYGGRLALATVDGTANPQLAQAFQVREVPASAAVVGGRPLSLFVGQPTTAEVRQVLDQVLEVAAQNGVTGRLEVTPPEPGAESAEEPTEPPLPPLHQDAYDAIERGDYPAAQDAYRAAIAQNPRDALAVAGLAQVSLLARVEGADAGAVRAAAAQHPRDLDAQLAVADLDLSGGHLEDAAGRLLDLFLDLDQAGRDRVRQRLLEYFEIAGVDDPRVGAARRRLTNLLY
ncbi:MAG: tetratricopeptide repeat protein [Micrococcales bacterium]|nr:tetratricopeptide repeat protein [Micrococcales bacterium]